MYAALTTLINRLDTLNAPEANTVIQWGCPVISFGDLPGSSVATLGLNPSNREFVDEAGQELDGNSRRFPTLQSLGIKSWSEADARHLRTIVDSCCSYFYGNPYDRWFKRLDDVVSATRASFYDSSRCACHLDLIPYATGEKWTDLTPSQKTSLLHVAGDTLALLLRDSSVEVLILNGQSVVNHFQQIAGVRLEAKEMPGWCLPRKSGVNVPGIAYKGVVDTVSGIPLSRDILVLGYNHNLQSSFGVTTKVIEGIRDWVGKQHTRRFQ